MQYINEKKKQCLLEVPISQWLPPKLWAYDSHGMFFFNKLILDIVTT